MKHSFLRVLTLSVFASLFLLASGTAFGQHQVSGTVMDSVEASPLPGANVTVKGTTRGTTSDAQGSYQLTVPSPADTLVFSFVGYQAKEIPIRGRNDIDVTLAPSTIMQEELVVVGYGTQERSDLTGSVSMADTDELKKSSSTNIADALEGQVAGVNVQTSGAPGESPAINIRGIGTFGSTSPLYVVDGVPVENIIDFNLNNIESVQVMKDAAASAIYGSRAANGVVIIETGSGQEEGGLQVSYNASVGTERIHQRIDMLGRERFQQFNNQLLANAGEPPAPANDPSSPEFVSDINTNWQDAALDRGYSTEHNLSISGGNETSTYSISAGYSSRDGHMQGPAPYYEQYTARINSTHEIGRLTLGENLSLTHSKDKPQSSQWENSLFAEMIKAPPTIPVVDESRLGGYGGSDAGEEEAIALNVVGINNLLERQQDVNRVLANVWGELQILDNLTYRLNTSYDSRGFHQKFFTPTFDLGFFASFREEDGQLDQVRNELVNAVVENTLTYDQVFGGHDVNVVAGYSEERRWFDENISRGIGYSRPFFKVVNQATNSESEGFRTESALRSFFGRLQYNYDDRYLLTASFRRDGSSRFGTTNQYGNFPSVSVGWRISEESFFDVSWVSNLKLRGSWGELGRQQIGDFDDQAFINTNANYNFNNQLADGAIQVNLANPSLKWETQVSRTVGVDASLFNGRFDATVEYYRNDSEDILVGVPIPGSFGAAEAPPANAASIRNTGFDVSLSYDDTLGDLNYELSTNVSTYNNEVISLGNGEPIFGAASRTAVGSEIGEIYGYVTDGIFQSWDEVYADDTPTHQNMDPQERRNATARQGFTAPGDIRFKDLNGDGVINEDDRAYLGSPTPDFTYGFTANLQYSNWDATIFLQGNYGNKIYNQTRNYVENMRDYNNTSVRAFENRWTEDDPHNDVRFPRAIFNDPNGNIRASDRWVEDGSYMRLKNLSVGYTLPQDLTARAGMEQFRVYVSGQNLLTLTGYSGLDPEVGTNSGDAANNNIANDGLFSRGFADAAWPHPRRFETGVQVTF